MATGRSVLKSFLYIINLFTVAGLIASYLAGYISPDKFWPLAFFGISYPFWLLANIIFVFVWLITWKRFIFISLVVILAGFHNLMALFPVRFATQESSGEPEIKVVSFNIHTLYGSTKPSKQPETKGKVTEFLARQHADIYCIQEFYALGEDFSQTLSKFANSIHLDHYAFVNYQNFSNKRKINAIATFSKYPVIRSRSLKLERGAQYALISDIVVGEDTVRVYNLHLESYRFGWEDYSFYSDLTEPDKDQKTPIQEGSKRMLWKLRKAFIIRSQQVATLAGDIKACPFPVILAGDFNDTPSSFTYHQLTGSLKDSFKETGHGLFNSTYAGQLPSFRIDYIMHSDQFRSVAYKTFIVDLSDHYPIAVSLVKIP